MYLGNNQMLEVGDVVQVSPVRSNGMTPYLVRVLGTQRQAPLQQAPAQQAPLQQTPAQQAPLQQAPAQQAPLQQAPAAAGTTAAGAGPAGAGAAGTAAAAALAATADAAGASAAGAPGDHAVTLRAGLPTRRTPATCSVAHGDRLPGKPAEQARRNASGQEQVAVFGKLAVDHADPVTASSTGCPCETGALRARVMPGFYRYDLDGLRGIAIALVAMFHVWFGRVSGGVDVFLALSGFFFGGKILRAALNPDVSLSPVAEVIRLVRRLLPALVVVLAGCAAADHPGATGDPLGDVRRPEPGQPRLLPELGAGQHRGGLPAGG